MGIDKYKAKKRAWRISERNLFIVAFFGGAIGSLLGMLIFKHKIRKWYFIIFIPVLICINTSLYYYLSYIW